MWNRRLSISGPNPFSGTHVVELENGTSLVTVAVRLVQNTNSQTLNIRAGDSNPPSAIVHSFPVGSPNLASPYRSSYTFVATEAFVSVEAPGEFYGDVLVYEAPQGAFVQAGTDPFNVTFADGNSIGFVNTGDAIFLQALVDQQASSISFNNVQRVTVGGQEFQTATNGLGFYGNLPTLQRTVLGDRSSGTALANLLAILEELGIVQDGTVA